MDIAIQSLNNPLSPGQAELSRADCVIKLAFDHRVHQSGLPMLPKKTFQRRLSNQIGSCSTLRVKHSTTPSNRQGQIVVSNSLTITAQVGHYHPSSNFAFVTAILARVSPQPREIWHINPWNSSGTPSQDDLRYPTDNIHPFCLTLVDAPRAGLVITADLSRRKAGAVSINLLFILAIIIQKLVLDILNVQHVQILVVVLQDGVVGDSV